MNGPEILFSASDEAKLFATKLFKNKNLEESGCLFYIFSLLELI